MKPRLEINFSKLFGFALIADHLSTAIDLRDDTVGARIGAKVGDKIKSAVELPRKSGTPEHCLTANEEEAGHGQGG
jgi:hypothetical protein